MKVAVTGANGFVGSALSDFLKSRNIEVSRLVRTKEHKDKDYYEIGNLGEKNNKIEWSKILKDVDCIVHCAGRVHLMKDATTDQLSAYRKINVLGTRRLAEEAIKNGVQRLVYLSSIKVNGEKTNNQSFKITDRVNPVDNYSISKLEAEEELLRISKASGLEVVIIRPPLIYGPYVKANFLRLLNLIHTGVPLPFLRLNNKRSMISLTNLIDFIVCCINHPSANGEKFLISDGSDFSTSELIRLLAKSMGSHSYLFYLPLFLFRISGLILGKSNEVERLTESLQIDISHSKELLGWKPVQTAQEGMAEVIDNFLSNKN